MEFTYAANRAYYDHIIEGWPPDRNRSFHAYISQNRDDTFKIRPSRAESKSFKVLMAVTSTVNSFKARMAVRETWGSFEFSPCYNCSLVFVVGTSNDSEVENKLLKESRRYGDVLQADVVDHYNNLTLKVAALIKYFVKTTWKVTMLIVKVLHEQEEIALWTGVKG